MQALSTAVLLGLSLTATERRDYLEFNVSIHELETNLQTFINGSFENIMSTEHALGLLKTFQAVLQRDNLKAVRLNLHFAYD